MASYITDIDVCYNATIYDVVQLLTAKLSSPKIIGMIAEGPGGGNPCLTMQTNDLEKLKKFLMEYHDSDDESWIMSLIQTED